MTGEGGDRAGIGAGAPSAPTEDELLVQVAAGLLDADCCEFLVEENGRLAVRATTAPGPIDAGRSYPLWTGIPGQAYSLGMACVVDDLLDTRGGAAAAEGPAATGAEFRSLCCVPVGDRGLLVGKAIRPGAFTDADRTSVERLAELTRAGLETAAAELAPRLDGGVREDRRDAERLEEIADILSHDLKNPLNVVQGNLQLAKETGDERHFEQAMSALERMEELIDELVVLARAGDHAEHVVTVDLHEQAKSAWEHIHTGAAALELGESVTFTGSERGVRHLLENLIENAIEYGGDSVSVRIGALDGGFYLEDDGPGIPSAHRDRIFERGYTVDAGTSGLGLYIVQRIVEAHGWDIGVREAATGGARFEITGIDTRDA